VLNAVGIWWPRALKLALDFDFDSGLLELLPVLWYLTGKAMSKITSKKSPLSKFSLIAKAMCYKMAFRFYL